MSHRNLSLLMAAFAFVGGAAFGQAQRAIKVDDVALRNVAQGKGEEWLSYGFTPQETQLLATQPDQCLQRFPTGPGMVL